MPATADPDDVAAAVQELHHVLTARARTLDAAVSAAHGEVIRHRAETNDVFSEIRADLGALRSDFADIKALLGEILARLPSSAE